MDSFFGIGSAELILILLLAGILMGPDKIRNVARFLGRLTAQLQGISREFARQLNAELDAVEGGEVREAMRDVRELQRQVKELQHELRTATRSLSQDKQRLVDDHRAAVEPFKHPLAAREAPPQEAGPQLPTRLEVPDDPE